MFSLYQIIQILKIHSYLNTITQMQIDIFVSSGYPSSSTASTSKCKNIEICYLGQMFPENYCDIPSS